VEGRHATHGLRRVVRAVGFCLSAVLAISGFGMASSDARTAVLQSPEMTYLSDGFVANRCLGPTDALHYNVFTPTTVGRHPIAFVLDGTGWKGSAECDPTTGVEKYRAMDSVARAWAIAGYVAIDIEVHGYANGLYGDLTYPGPGLWQGSGIADADVEIDVKAAVRFFFAHSPLATYGADERLGLVAVGSSSGAHDAHMLSLTGVAGHRFTLAVAWSGFPAATLGGAYGEGVFDTYMRATRGSDVENFGDPIHRLSSTSPPQYVSNATGEFINEAAAEAFVSACRALGVIAWLREPDSSNHAAGYLPYVFTGIAPERSDPPATIGQTVAQDSWSFASLYRAAP